MICDVRYKFKVICGDDCQLYTIVLEAARHGVVAVEMSVKALQHIILLKQRDDLRTHEISAYRRKVKECEYWLAGVFSEKLSGIKTCFQA